MGGVWFILACSEWPRFAHLPEDTGVAHDPGTEVGEDYPWTPGAPHDDRTDGTPATAGMEPLDRGGGLLVTRALAGSGWSAEAPERETCTDGTSSRFPVYETGQYTGDVDWWVIELQDAGVLCSTLVGANDALRTDVMMFHLGGACSLPVEGPAFEEDGQVLGYAAESATTTWATAVEAGVVALVAAAYAPDGEADQPYRWGVALLEPDDNPSAARCPNVSPP